MSQKLRVRVAWTAGVGRLVIVLDNEVRLPLAPADKGPRKSGINVSLDLPRPTEAHAIEVIVACSDDLKGINGTVALGRGEPVKLEGQEQFGTWVATAEIYP